MFFRYFGKREGVLACIAVAFIVYVRMFPSPMLMLTDPIASMQSLAASTERIFDLLPAPEMEDETSRNPPQGQWRDT